MGTDLVKTRQQLNEVVIDRGPLGCHAAPRTCHATTRPGGRDRRSVSWPPVAGNSAMPRSVRQHSASRGWAPATGTGTLLATALASSSLVRCRRCILQSYLGNQHRRGTLFARSASSGGRMPCRTAGILPEAFRKTIVDLRLQHSEGSSIPVSVMTWRRMCACPAPALPAD
jgi:hypothetical protein